MFLAKMLLVAGVIAAALLTSPPPVSTERIPERPQPPTSPALRHIVRQLVCDNPQGALAVVRTPSGIHRAQDGLARKRPCTTIAAINDNNFPFSTGRNPAFPDYGDFIVVRTAPLN